jgi:very-short-patch-repair endonuclease
MSTTRPQEKQFENPRYKNTLLETQTQRNKQARIYRHELRVKATVAEQALIKMLKPGIKKHYGVDCIFQHVIHHQKSFFILDIYITKAKLCIEIDGLHHKYNYKQRFYDGKRDELLESMGIATRRFTNHEVNEDIRTVCNKIASAVRVRLGVESRTNKDAQSTEISKPSIS